MKNMTENSIYMKTEKAMERLITITKRPENECWLGISNWHENGETEPFDNFYDSALEELSRNR